MSLAELGQLAVSGAHVQLNLFVPAAAMWRGLHRVLKLCRPQGPGASTGAPTQRNATSAGCRGCVHRVPGLSRARCVVRRCARPRLRRQPQ
jgi:hypothetical protein